MNPRPIPDPDLAALCRKTAAQVAAWTSLAMVASIVLQVIVGA